MGNATQSLSYPSESVPNPSELTFVGKIIHPELYLWDCWSYKNQAEIHIFTLAIHRYEDSGALTDQQGRTLRELHVRHFVSQDGGDSWKDKGCFASPSALLSAEQRQTAYDGHSIWSGSMLMLEDERKIFAYTGIKSAGPNYPFIQSLALIESPSGQRLDPTTRTLLSSSLEDWQSIRDLGYFLDDKEKLGDKEGEQNGPILAWRDPFMVHHQDQVHVFWCAKSSSHCSALAHATLVETEQGFEFDKISPPMLLPDSEQYTQLEVPKVIYDNIANRFYLIIGTCDRVSESQPDQEVTKQVRMYQAESIYGPWREAGHVGSVLELALDNVFGIEVIDADFANGELYYMAPLTELADGENSLSISGKHTLDLNSIPSL